MSDIQSLLAEMRSFSERAGLSVSTVSTRAAGDGKFYSRLEGGAEALPRTIRKVRAWMDEHAHLMKPVEHGDAA